MENIISHRIERYYHNVNKFLYERPVHVIAMQ